MSLIKRWLWELIENGEYEYLISLGAPEWAVAEALAFAQKETDDDSDLDDWL